MIKFRKVISKVARCLLPAVLAVALVIPLTATPVLAAPVSKDYYETDAGVNASSTYGTYWRAQTFEASSTYLASSVKIKSYTIGAPPTATAYLHDTHPETGKPTGAAIATGSQATGGWASTEGTRAFHQITFASPVILVEGEEYAIVIKTDGADSSNAVKWQYNNETVAYVNGNAWQTTDSGGTWTEFVSAPTNNDFLFQVWGEVDASYPVMTTGAASSVTTSTATLNGTLTDLGAGAANADVYFEWGYLNGTYAFSTTPVNKTSVPANHTADINLPVGGRVYKYRMVAENDLSKESYGSRILFTSSAPPSTVTADNYVARQGAITHVFQRKGWYTVERNWIIYCKGHAASPTGGFYWRSSDDGSAWTDPYLFIESENGNYWNNYPIGGSNEGDELNVYFDGTYLHAVYVWNRNIPLATEPNTVSNNIWYRRGIPAIDGTISWTSDWVIALARSDDTVKGYASITTDSNGYPFIDYWESAGLETAEGSNYATPTGALDRKVIRSTTKDGTFTATSPYTLHTNIANRGTGVLVQLPAGKVYWVGVGESQTPKIAGRLWNGSAWETEVTIVSTDAWGCYRFSVVTRGDIIYVVYANLAKTKIKFTKMLSTGWTTPIDIVIDLPISGGYYTPAPAMTINGATGDLYVFYQNFTTDHIFYIMWTAATDTWEASVDWIDESHNQLAYDDLSTSIGSYFEVYGGRVGVYYQTTYPSWTYSAAAQHDIDLRYAYLEAAAGAAVQTNAASSITDTTATLQGYLINDGGETCSVRFQWGTDITYGTNTDWQPDKNTGDSFSKALSGLVTNTTYYYRAQAKWADGTTTSGNGRTFTTTGVGIPTVSTSAASGVAQTTAVLNGNLISLGGYTPVYVSFQYGTTTAYGSTTVDQSRVSTGTFNAGITGLTANTTYHARARVRYNSSYVYGADISFATPAATTPVITTEATTSITTTGATLQGNLSSLGSYDPVYVYFQYGSSTSYGSETSQQSKSATTTFSQAISGLLSGSTYHYRAVVKYNSSYIYGVDATFTTVAEAPPDEPGIPTNFRVTATTTTSISLGWAIGTDATNTIIRSSTTGYPTSPTAGNSVYSGTGTTTQHSGLTTDTRYYYSAWSQAGSTYSSTYVTATGVPTTDILAIPDTFTIETLQIYRDYINTGDNLIVFSYEILWNEGLPTTLNPEDFFYIQVLDGSVVIKQDRIKMWGYVPGSLYVSYLSPLEWNKEYTFKIIGTSKFTTPPSVTYDITSSNYMGGNYDYLVTWVLDMATRMQSSAYWDSLIEYSQARYMLNSLGSQVFTRAIPGLANKCPTLFYPTGEAPDYTPPDPDTPYSDSLLDRAEDSHGTMTWGIFQNFANLFEIPIATIAWAFWAALYFGGVILIAATTKNIGAGIVIALPVLLVGTQFGAIPMSIVIGIGIFGIFIWYLKGGVTTSA